MLLRFTKTSDLRHVLEVEREGARERAELETRSTLFHDFTHLAVEEAAGIEEGFFGSLARGASLAELAGRPDERPRYGEAMMQVERAVAVLQRLAKRDEDPALLHARLAEEASFQGEPLPGWFTAELVTAVRERLRALLGRWRATPYGGCMEHRWQGGGGG